MGGEGDRRTLAHYRFLCPLCFLPYSELGPTGHVTVQTEAHASIPG